MDIPLICTVTNNIIIDLKDMFSEGWRVFRVVGASFLAAEGLSIVVPERVASLSEWHCMT